MNINSLGYDVIAHWCKYIKPNGPCDICPLNKRKKEFGMEICCNFDGDYSISRFMGYISILPRTDELNDLIIKIVGELN